MNYDAINENLLLGHGIMHGSMIPDIFDYYVPVPTPKHDPARARALLAEAGYPNGFDAGFYNCDASYSNLAEVVVNNLAEVGIRARLRPLERAAFAKAYTEEEVKGLSPGRERGVRKRGDAV